MILESSCIRKIGIGRPYLCYFVFLVGKRSMKSDATKPSEIIKIDVKFILEE